MDFQFGGTAFRKNKRIPSQVQILKTQLFRREKAEVIQQLEGVPGRSKSSILHFPASIQRQSGVLQIQRTAIGSEVVVNFDPPSCAGDFPRRKLEAFFENQVCEIGFEFRLSSGEWKTLQKSQGTCF